ncbi:MAG TPA: DUF4349 domain-containing protein [Candidatus Limnocylindrales bacterium]|jgi:hypothetical protein
MRSPFRGRRSGGRSAAALSLLLVGVVAVACGASGAAAPAAAPRDANGSNLPAASAGGANPGDLLPDASPTGAAGGSGSGGTGDGGDAAAIFDDTKIVRTGSLQMTVDDVAKALASGRDAIRNLGGYIGASQQERSDDKTVASVTYRIPVARWEDALDALRRLGTEVAEKTDAAEVTGQIVDLAARITNLKASEAALVGYAQKAPKVSDLLEIEARLTDTRGQIERLTAQQAALQDQAALATLTVTFGTDVVAVQETAQRWDPAAEVDRASATLIGIGQALVSIGIVVLIVWVPLILAISIVAALALFVLRRVGWTRPNRFPPLPPIAPPPTSADL